jgi:hypothetical protein
MSNKTLKKKVQHNINANNYSDYDIYAELDIDNTVKNNESKIIENFGCFLGIGDCAGSQKETNNIDNSKRINKNIDSSILEKSVNNIVNAAMVNALLNNKQTITAMAQADNILTISGNNLGANGTISGINQSATSTTKVDSVVKQENVAVIANDFITEISNIVDKSVKEVQLSSDRDVSTKQKGLGDAYKAAVDAAASSFKGVFGGNPNMDKTNNINNSIQEEIKIDDSINKSSENNVKNIMESLLSTENLANAISNARSANSLIIANNTAKSITNINQEAISVNITNVMIDQVNKINIGNKVLNKIADILKAVSDKYVKSENVSGLNELDNTGEALAAVITAGGNAGAAVLEGVGNMVAAPIKGVGSAIGNMGFIFPIMIAIVIIIVVFMLLKN